MSILIIKNALDATLTNPFFEPKKFAVQAVLSIYSLFLRFLQTPPSQPNGAAMLNYVSILHSKPPLPSGAGISNIHHDENYGEKDSQPIFNQWFAKTIQQTLPLLQNPIESILTSIGQERGLIAKKLGHNNMSLFGELRNKNQAMRTPICKDTRYALYFDQCSSLLKKRGPIVFKGLLPGKTGRISLSGLFLIEDLIRIEHPTFSESTYKEIISYLDKKFRALMNESSSSKELLLETLATIHWWLAHLMIFQRGSACITEIFIQAIAAAKGFPSTHWKPETMPDLEAILTDHDTFVSRYGEFFLFGA